MLTASLKSSAAYAELCLGRQQSGGLRLLEKYVTVSCERVFKRGSTLRPLVVVVFVLFSSERRAAVNISAQAEEKHESVAVLWIWRTYSWFKTKLFLVKLISRSWRSCLSGRVSWDSGLLRLTLTQLHSVPSGPHGAGGSSLLSNIRTQGLPPGNPCVAPEPPETSFRDIQRRAAAVRRGSGVHHEACNSGWSLKRRQRSVPVETQ